MGTYFLAQIVGSFPIPAGENPTVAMLEAAFPDRELTGINIATAQTVYWCAWHTEEVAGT